MKKNICVLLLVVLALSMINVIFAQEAEEYTKEELLVMIAEQKQLIRETAKEFLVDTLPGLMERDPDEADRKLAELSGLFNTMDQNDFIYLLGHFYARMGENTRAISSFNSLIKTKLNEDARKMLNLVLYKQMVVYLQNNDRKAAKDFLRAIVLENYNIDRYYPTYLYIWADMTADDGDFETVASILNGYNQNRDIIINQILPNKKAALAKLQTLDLNSFYANPTADEYNNLISQIDAYKIELTQVYNQLIAMKGIIYLDSVVNLHKEEMAMLDGLKKNLTDFRDDKQRNQTTIADGYAKLQAVKDFSLSYQKQIAVMDRILQAQYERFLTNDPAIQGKNFSDMELKRLYDIEQLIQFYDENIAFLDQSIADPDLAARSAEMKTMRGDFSDKRVDLVINKKRILDTRKHTDDAQEQFFDMLLNEYYAMNGDKKDLDLQIADLDEFFKTDAKDIFDDSMREEIKRRMATDLASTMNSDERDEPIRLNARDMITNIDFITLQLTFRNLHSKELARLALQGKVTDAELAEKRNEILAEKRELVTKIKSFIALNPDFMGMAQPNDSYLITNADLYFDLGELQYATDLDNPSIPLDSYRKVVQLDPNFINKDAALYNIGFLSSQINRTQIDSNRSRFYELNKTALQLDANSRYKPSDFSEALGAYQEIVDNYKESTYYDESLYRMGILNYYLATDSDDPAKYYTLATNCFNEIIEKPGSKYRYDAIYQRGWLRLNSQNEDDLKLAMGDFLTLLTAIENKQITDPVLMQDYRDDAVDNIAYCLIALDGADYSAKSKGVAELKALFGDFSNKDIISRVVDKAAEKKFNLAASMQAVDFIWLKINMNPLALENPCLMDSILYIYARDPRNLRDGKEYLQATQDIYLTIISTYGKDSEWYNLNKDKDISNQLLVVKKAYEERGKRLKNECISMPSEENLTNYKVLMDSFGAFTQLHGDGFAAWQLATDKDIITLSTMLAESSKLPLNYVKAIDLMHSFTAKYPDDEDYFYYEGLSNTYSGVLWKMLNERYAQADYQSEPGLPANLDELYTMYSTNTLRFVNVLLSEKYRDPAKEKDANNLILNLADLQYGREKFPEATTLYLKALEQEPIMDASSKFDVYGKLALMARQEQKHALAEQYFRSALAFAQTPEKRAGINAEISLEIQSSYESAQAAGDFSLAASERLRLAAELGKQDPARIQGLKWGAQEAYVKSKEYQKAIDLLLELAESAKDVEEAYTLYFRAWEIAEADTAMNNPALGAQLKDRFVAAYPKSNRAYNIRLLAVQKMEENPAELTAAAEAYLVLHEEARNKAINTGEHTPDQFLSIAAEDYRKAGNTEKQLELYNRFLTLYPNHQNVIPYMQVIADDYLAKGDTLRFEQMAKDIYTKDKTKNDRYQFIAELKLNKLMLAFDTAYRNKNYLEAFKQRDNYLRVEAAYVRDGLSFTSSSMNSAQNTAYFASVKKEYDNIQQYNAFLKNFESQIAAIEKGAFLNGKPADFIKVNANTKWQENMIGGTKRIPVYKNSVNAEVKKVLKILEQADATEFQLDNSQRLHAQFLISRIYRKGYEVIQTQVGVYVRTAIQTSQVRVDNPGEALDKFINNIVFQQNNDLRDQEYLTYLRIYNLYYLAGYTDVYTQKVVDRLQELKWTPEYKTEEYPLSSGWTQSIDDASANLNTKNVSSPKGVKLGSADVPAGKELKLTKNIDTRIAPDYALLQLVYPYDIQIRLNGTDVAPSIVPTDTLEAGKPITTRNSYLLQGVAWKEGQNALELIIPNTTSQAQTLSLSLQVFTDRRRLAESIPTETITLLTDTKWRVVHKNAETGEETTSSAVLATNFGITTEQIDGMKDKPAKPIWLPEEAPVASAIFETDFTLDTEFKQGSIEFIAPENLAVYLNGDEIASNLALEYDPDPLMVYSSELTLDPSKVKPGKNTLRFVVTNASAYRGFEAAVTIVKAGKEDIR